MRDLMGMMKQAKELQERMQQMQAELDTVEVEGASGGGLVTVRVTAKGETKAVRIDPSLLKAEEGEILEDLLVSELDFIDLGAHHLDAPRTVRGRAVEQLHAP